MNVTLNENEVLIIKAALTRVYEDNRAHNCAVGEEFDDLMIKIETAARIAESRQLQQETHMQTLTAELIRHPDRRPT